MKYGKWMISALVCGSVVIVGCGQQASTVKPPTQATQPAQATQPVQKTQPTQDTQLDPWTYYKGTQWSDNYQGLTLQVEEVALSDIMPKFADDETSGQYSSVVGVKFKMVNSTSGKFTFFPDQAKLVTSNGEQVDMPNMFNTTHLGGEIDGGVTKEGDIVWLLQRTTASDIKWITISFRGHAGAEDDFSQASKQYEIKLNLK